jgi:hypothetical protein
VVYDGPSQIDGQRIVAIVLTGQSTNRKTGAMVQTYIIRPDVDPISAVRQGLDASICGDCKHRGDGTGKGRTCYVTLMHGPSAVYRTLIAGKYPTVALGMDWSLTVASLGRGRQVRLGTYGDPAAVPEHVWRTLLSEAAGWTGYTHQWRSRPSLRDLVMASVDSPAEHATATAQGWRTFRVRTVEQPLEASEIACPASEEQGKRTTCADCGLCKGTSSTARKTISIIAHGTAKRHFASA